MKELSIEEKAKAYDEAIEKLRNAFYDNNSRMCEDYRNAVLKIIEPIFPELAESEDERIRKWLIKDMGRRLSCWTSTEVTKEQVLAWLEKQGEQKPAWSEEDKCMLNNVIDTLKPLSQTTHSGYAINSMIDWLKSLRPQNVWISVDEEVYVKEPVLAQKKDKSDPFGGFVVCCDHTLTPNVYERYMILGNIVSQSTWKPSDEQMKAFGNILKFFHMTNAYGETIDELKELLEQLKEL